MAQRQDGRIVDAVAHEGHAASRIFQQSFQLRHFSFGQQIADSLLYTDFAG